MKKIGLFGGTFDPIHLGHLSLAIQIMEAKGLDEVLFCPAWQSPHKVHSPTDGGERLKMIELAIGGIPGLQVTDVELKRAGPSYTIDTLKLFEGAEITLIMSDEAARTLADWKEPLDIVKRAKLAVGSRIGLEKTGVEEIDDAIEAGRVPTHVMEISATDIRKRLKEGKPCQHLVPAPVLNYLSKKGIFLDS